MRIAPLALISLALVTSAAAKPAGNPIAEAQALDLAKQTMAMRSVQGPGNRTGDVARAHAAALVAGGWRSSDIEIVPLNDTAYLLATWPGSDPKRKALVISGHLDVVEAKPSDWERDPFTPVIENGMLYGRGASDMKVSAALAVASLIELRRQGFRPKRSIVIAFSGDEETSMATSRVLADRLAGSEMVLNIDGGSGVLDEKTGQPVYWSWDGAEKTYVDFRLEVTNPGGHSSAPRPDNAIAQLATAVQRIADYRFKPEINPLTKAWFEAAAALESNPARAAAMRAFAANPNDPAALALLRADPATVGKTGTTCVPTLIAGGHAENALPQKATANINCRVFPGHTREEIMAELAKAANVPQVKIIDASGGDTTFAPPSPMRADFVAAVSKAMRLARGRVPIVPTQISGATDNMWFRTKGVDSYGMSPLFIKDSDDFSHGLNERVPVSNFAPGIVYYLSVFRDLSAK